MDIATVGGLILCIALMVFGIFSNGESIGTFIHTPSILITFGGAFSSVLISFKLKDFINGLKGIGIAIKQHKYDQTETIKNIIELSNIARKEGLLALEEAANNLDDQFMKKGILLIVDGTEPDLVRAIMETELSCVEERHKKVINFWEVLAAMGPAWGMVGTLIGLIAMLQHMSDASTIGPSMSTALITTFYGSVLANWMSIPIANKLRQNNAEETTLKEVMIEGLLSIQAGENPRVIEEKLKSFLAPEQRNKYSEGTDDGGEKVG